MAAPAIRSCWAPTSSWRCGRSRATAVRGICWPAAARSSSGRSATSVETWTQPKIWRGSAMKLEQSFEVEAPLEQVWSALIDVQRVAPCLPGAAVTGRNEDGSYNGTFTIKIGPTTASYTGKLEMEEVDEAGHNATMNAQGTDKRGQGGATAKIVSRLEPVDDDHTRVSVDTDYRITGR